MKPLFLLMTIAIITQCKSVQFDTNPPFKITKAIYKKWVGGQPGISGTNVFINYTPDATIVFDSLYFRNKTVKIALITKENNTQIRGYFNTSTRKSYDLIFHQNPTKELQNKIPEMKNFPFSLSDTEAVVSYKEGHKIKYFKVALKKEKTDFYP